MANDWKYTVELLYSGAVGRSLTQDEKAKVIQIGSSMLKKGEDTDLVLDAVEEALSKDNMAIYVLMNIWNQKKEDKEKKEVSGEFKKYLNHLETYKNVVPIDVENLELIKKYQAEIKQLIKKKIEEKGGVREFTRKHKDFNESSLSRFFRYSGTPKKQYLKDLMDALKIDKLEVEVSR